MIRVRRCALVSLAIFLLSPTTVDLLGQSTIALNNHTVRLDASGKLLAWSATQNDAYDEVLRLSTDYLLNRIPTGANGLKLYFGYSYADPGTPVRAVGWPHNPAGLFAMLADSGLAYYAYSGNPAIMKLVRDVLTYHLDHGMTPSTWDWPNVAFASSDPGALDYQGAHWGDSTGVGDGFGVIQPDKVAEIGVAFLRYYEYSGAPRFRDASIQAADALASHVRVGSASQSPWPFRTYGQTNVIREQYSAHVIAPIRLFDELIRLKLGSVDDYRAARETAWTWLMTYPMQNNVWSNYFEDVAISSDRSNTNQLVAGETARYLMTHPEFDPNWEAHARGIITWIEGTFASSAFGANRIAEQQAFFHPMGSHTSRYASLNAQLFELTGDQVAREKAYRSFNWATYMCGLDGVVIDGPTVNHVWWTDGYGDYIKHFVAGLGSVPEWSPENQSHLLRSTSVVRNIQYTSGEITYQTFDGVAQEVLRLNFTPQGVAVDSVALQHRAELNQEGWTFDAATGVLRVRHDSGTNVRITSGPPVPNVPPVVLLDSPAPGSYVTSALILAATATDTDGSISRVEFFQNGVPLGVAIAPPFAMTWESVQSGTYQLTAVATDDRGGSATSATVEVRVTAPVPPMAPTNLLANLSDGMVNLTWSPPAGGPAVSAYNVYRSSTGNFVPSPGNLLGQSSTPGFVDRGLGAGTYYYRVVAVDAVGTLSATSNEATTTVGGGLAVDKVIFSDGTGTRGTSVFSTTFSGELLLAFVASDGPSNAGQTFTVGGAGLSWTLVRRVNTQRGAAEIWQAKAANRLTNVVVTSTPAIGGYHQSLTVVAFTGAGGVGASAVANASAGAPSVSLTTTKAGALVYGVGNDWDGAVARTPVAGQILVHQWIDTGVGDTFWVQATSAAIANAGTIVQLGASSPTNHRWNFAAVEITPTAMSLPPVTVPSITGLSQSSARTLIEAAGLLVGSITTQASTTVPVGYVIGQNPAADTQVPPGRTVGLVTSSGAQLVVVPNLVSQSDAAARTLIDAAGLVVGTVTNQSSNTVPIGRVVSQNPPASSQAIAGSAVDFAVSLGPQLVLVPNAVGQTQAAAASAIAAAGLLSGAVTHQASTTVAAGNIISQNPMPGAQVPQNTAVNLVVSSGPQPVSVPNVVGQAQAIAASSLAAAGLTIGALTNQSSSTVALGSVISQNPAPGAQVAAGTAVALTLSSGSPAGPAVPVAVDKTVFSDGTGTRRTSAFSTAFPGELLLAFVASDGPSSGAQTITVGGAGLTWTLVRRVNTQRGASEIWQATAPNQLTNVTVTATPALGGYHQSLTVVTFSGAAGVGASATANASSGAPSVSVTTTKPGSFVYGVGNDWDRAVARTPVANQVLVHQWVDTSVGDTFWVQATAAKIVTSGTVIQLRDSSPTNDRWNFAAVEILAK